MEALFVVVGIGLGVAFVALQILGLQVAANAMQPDEDLSLGTAAWVWLLAGIASLGASCTLTPCLLWIPVIGLLTPFAVVVAVYTLVLATFARIDHPRALLAVTAWVLAQAMFGTVVWAAVRIGSSLVG